ncbi:MAG: protein kinase [Planctomycetes bacterium]|nr:protein kinase [Planctomycetota bacterium]
MKSRETQPATAFERSALASGLLDQEQLDEARGALRDLPDPPASNAPGFDDQLAAKLVELQHLNLWQSKQLLEGRTKFNLGPYWMVDFIGRGGMGQVFKAEHSVLRRIVAVKVLPRSMCTPDSIANFMRETRVLAKLDHVNLVRALDAGEDGNVYYLVTEFVPGVDLRKLVRRDGPMSMEAAGGIISQVAGALGHAHQQGLIHRDIKPGNVLVTPDGHAKLSDLGLAGPLDGDAEDDPRFGKIVGTADYLAPDHIQAPWDPTPAWDIYSLGCTLYYAVTGKVPFPGGTTADKVRAQRELRPLDPRRLNPTLSVPFLELLAEMMAKDPAERLPTAESVIDHLKPWADAPAPVVLSDHKPNKPRKSSARSPSKTSAAQSPVDAAPAEVDEADLEDTESSFPEIPDAPVAPSDHSSELSQTTHSVGSAGQETSASVDGLGQSAQPLPFLHPLVVLVLLPVALVGLVVLVWWISQLF